MTSVILARVTREYKISHGASPGLAACLVGQQLDGPSLSWRSCDEAARFEGQDHLMYGRRRDSKVLLLFGLRRRTSVDLSVVINKSQILALFVRISIHPCQQQAKTLN